MAFKRSGVRIPLAPPKKQRHTGLCFFSYAKGGGRTDFHKIGSRTNALALVPKDVQDHVRYPRHLLNLPIPLRSNDPKVAVMPATAIPCVSLISYTNAPALVPKGRARPRPLSPQHYFNSILFYLIKLVLAPRSATGTSIPARLPASIQDNSQAILVPILRMVCNPSRSFRTSAGSFPCTIFQ